MSLNEIKSTEKMDKETILELVRQMQEAIKEPAMQQLKARDSGRYICEMQNRCSRLNDRYPGIFNMVIQYEDQFDQNKLIWIIDLVAKRQSGKQAAEENERIMGQRMVDEYIPEELKQQPTKEMPE